MLERKKIIDVLILVMAVAAVVISMYIVQRESYQNGFTAAKNLVENSSLGAMLRTPDDVRSLYGTVTAVNDTSIMLHIESKDPFENPSLNERVIFITSSTTITRFTQKDSDVLQKELAAYAKIMQSKPTPENMNIQRPRFFALATITLADIKVGEKIFVTASANVKYMKEFIASEVQAQPLTTVSSEP